jgi:HSP20 family protein
MLFRLDDFEPFAAHFGPMEDFRRRFERVFEELDREWKPARAAAPLFADRGDAIELTADLPGVAESDLSLTLNQDVLTLGVKRAVLAPEGYRPHRQERAGFQATRSFALPCRVDPEKVRATMENGVLTVRLAKAAESQPRRVSVNVA